MLSPPDLDVVRRDSALPGLATVLDPLALQEVLRRFRPDLDAGPDPVTYVRYKPRTSCLVGFRARIDGRDVLLSVRARDPAARDKLSKAEEKRGLPGPLGPGYLVIADLALIVSVFPNDRRLPQLRRIAEPAKERSLLRKLGAHHRAVRHGRLDYLRFRPERRCVTRVVGDDGPAGIVKFHGKADYARAVRNAAAFASMDLLHVPRPIANSDEHMAVASEWLAGEHVAPGPDIAARTGAALALLHRQQPLHLSRLTRGDQRRALRGLAMDFATLWPPHAGHVHTLADRLCAALAEEHGHLRAIHGDFHFDQVLAREDGIGFVDFDEAAHGPPAWDLGDFVGHLHRRAISFGPFDHAPDSIGEALYDGYRSVGGDVSLREMRLQTAVALMRLAARPFRDRHPAWPEVMGAILDRVDGLIGSPARIAAVEAPRDAAMPLIEAALEPEEMERQIAAAAPGLCDRVTAARLVRHKPGRRCLIEYRMTDDAGGTSALIAKMRARGADERTFALQRRLWECDFGPDAADGVMVPEPVAILPALDLWLQRKVPGRSLGDLLAEGTAVDPAQAAAALAKLHHADVTIGRRHTLSDELRILDGRLAVLADRRPPLAGRLGRLMGAATALAARATPARRRGIHRDFYPDHLLIEGNKLYILDLDLFCAGDAAVDVGNFLAHLTEQGIRSGGLTDRLIDWQRGFEAAYRRLMTDVSAANIRLYELLSLARLVEISDRMPARRPFTETLLEHCEGRVGAELAYRRMGHDS